MPSHGFRTETHSEGVTVIGEAVQRIPAERAEFLIEVSATAPSAAQALRENYLKTNQITQAVSALGVQQTDIHTISVRVHNLYSPVMTSQSAQAALPPIGLGIFSPYSVAGPGIQPEVQSGSYRAANTLRIQVREPGRLGEITDTVSRVGSAVVAGFSFRSADDAAARRAALEAAAKDARVKAETLATAVGRQIADAAAITEDAVVSNGTYAALRATAPFAFGAGAPEVAGELEYYARVSASFRFQ